jgi:hypothetical protein
MKREKALSIGTRGWAALLGAALLALGAPMAWAQDEEGGNQNAPQILTSDLARRQTTAEPKLRVDFVVIDTDRVVEVSINGEAQKIQPGTTVVVSKEFTFSRPQTRIEVTAKDEAGNSRTLAYLVLKPGAEEAMAEGAPRITPFARAQVRYEYDSNPSNDLSTPITISGVDVQGVVPDSDQPDTRYAARAIGGITYGKYNGLLGASITRYTKSDNEQFESTILFLGAGARTSNPGQNGFVASYLFTDINLGSFDYSQSHTLSPGYEFNSSGPKGTSRNLVGVDIILKDFSRGDQKDATQFTVKWDHFGQDVQKEDSLRSLLAAGNSTEGFDESEYNFVSLDQDWTNKWGSGFRFDVGYGIAYRDYPNDEPLSTDTPLGDTRVDAPMRISLAPGWQFNPKWYVLLGYRYVFNLSNKQPYVRQIYGVTVDGTF